VPPGSKGVDFVDLTVRAVVCGLGAATMLWAVYTAPVFWQAAPFEKTAKYIIAGENIKPAVVGAFVERLGGIESGENARPSILSNVAIIRLRLLERAIFNGDQKTIDKESRRLQVTTVNALSNNPADSFLWVVLFWVENTRNGFSRDHIDYLRMSYLTGPDEGWIGVKRNRLALSVFPQLPSDVANEAVAEFAHLIDSQFIPEMADILVGPGWPIRGTLLAGLNAVELVNRERFAKTVYRLGYDITVPGVKRRGQRPWD